ncbi:type 1 glutamine amidotransferase [Chryseobacterium profundimaris]|uniref:GMP synthase-Glutamine amidotransferase n=1 Tax=Chryseobacterium profundimaris TaxID=1387275 RepID=A0ABY1NI25_9FLAO|nr:GMP synthase [Chryseobacterium profundimaris]SMP10091.1 GMP synthase-Glutamine amidotransferase [Chryseobacterium profundimaris]
MDDIRIALLDMNNNQVNQGFKNIKEISESFRQSCKAENVSITTFDVRSKNEIPDIEDFDIFISSGGPGNPHREGFEWEDRFSHFLDSIFSHNRISREKKFLFLICHSFQLASIHWKLGNICKRKSYSFGVMPVHKTEEGEEEFLFKNLPDPFYAVDSRAYQFIEPDYDHLEKLGMKITAIEKFRPHIDLERAVMAVRFSDEIFGTQFHPEANPEGMIENLKDEKNKLAMIENFGMEKYLETIDRIDDEDKITLTQSQILPRFLDQAKQNIISRNNVLI